MCWCRQATGHYRSQCWPRFSSPYHMASLGHNGLMSLSVDCGQNLHWVQLEYSMWKKVAPSSGLHRQDVGLCWFSEILFLNTSDQSAYRDEHISWTLSPTIKARRVTVISRRKSRSWASFRRNSPRKWEQGKSGGFDSCAWPSHLSQIGFKSSNFLLRVTLKCDGWPWKIRHLFYATSSFLTHFIDISDLKLELRSGNVQFGSKLVIFVPCDFEIDRVTLKNNRTPPLCHTKQCASFHCHIWIQIGVTIRKQLNWTLTCDLDIWPWPFAWTSFLSMVIAPGTFVMIRWQKLCVTDVGQTNWTIHRDAWS